MSEGVLVRAMVDLADGVPDTPEGAELAGLVSRLAGGGDGGGGGCRRPADDDGSGVRGNAWDRYQHMVGVGAAGEGAQGVTPDRSVPTVAGAGYRRADCDEGGVVGAQ